MDKSRLTGIFKLGLLIFNLLSFLNFLFVYAAWVGISFWPTELVISFLPQQILLTVILLGVNSLFIIQNIRLRLGILKHFIHLVSLAAITVCVYGIYQIYSFSLAPTSIPVVVAEESLHSVRIASFNKLYDNFNYSQMAEGILQVDADVIGIIEVDPEGKLPKLLQKKYPYSFVSEDNFAYKLSSPAKLILFSKTELRGSRYIDILGSPNIYTQTEIRGQTYQIMLVHPFSPLHADDFTERNRQLPLIAQNAKEIMDQDKPGIVMGDFNVSPWSPTYRDFEEKLSGFSNTARGHGIEFSWDAGKFFVPNDTVNSFFFQSKIDHIFVSNNLQTVSFEVEGNYGSDHNLIWADVVAKL